MFSRVQSSYVIGAAIVLSGIMVGSALYELRQSKEELLHVLHSHASSTAAIINRSSENVLLATDEVEEQLSHRLLTHAYYISRLDSLGILTEPALRSIAESNGIFRINIFDRRGQRVMGSHVGPLRAEGIHQGEAPRELIQPILRGETSRLIIGLRDIPFEDGTRYAVAIRRTHRGGGAIVMNLDAGELLDFRRRIGIGRLISDIGEDPGVVYAVIQDAQGIIAATSQVEEMSAMEDDPFLTSVGSSDSIVTRETTFGDRGVFEAVTLFRGSDAPDAVLRIGLSLEEVDAAETRMFRRILVMFGVITVLTLITIIYILTAQRSRLLETRISAMQTFTGSVLESMGDAVVSLDELGRVTVFNPRAAAMFELEPSEVLGRQVHQLPMHLGAFLGAEEMRSGDHTVQTPRGTVRRAAIQRSVSQDAAGAVRSTTLVIRDVTEARRMEEALRRQQKLTAMGELASSVAHEVRNPLNAMAMVAQRFEKEFEPEADKEEYRSLTALLRTEAKRVNGIIEQFLRFARPPKVEIATVPAAPFVDRLTGLIEPAAREKQVRFSVIGDRGMTLRMDSDQMLQALLNLLRNALEATPEGGTVALSMSQDDQRSLFEVEDSGPGVPPGLQDKIFNLYFSTKPQGTGLGLPMVQQIVSQHGGTITLESEHGKGTRFRVEIPR